MCIGSKHRTDDDAELFDEQIPDIHSMAPRAKMLVLGLKGDLRGDAEIHGMLKERNLDFISPKRLQSWRRVSEPEGM